MTVRVEFEFRDEKEAEIFKNYIEKLYIGNKGDMILSPLFFLFKKIIIIYY